MKKDTARRITALSVILILYILVAFLIPFAHTATFWFSFAFTIISFGVVAISIYTAFIQKPDAKSRFYRFPVAKIGVIYGAVQLIAGIIFMALAAIVPAWVAALVYAIALGAAIIGLISAEAVISEIKNQGTKLQKNVSLMRSLQYKVNHMASQCDDSDAAMVVKKFAEELRYSDPVSSDALAEIESTLSATVDELQSAIIDGDVESIKCLCRKANAVLVDRNQLCKLHKN